MRRTVSAMEARKRFGELLESVYYRGDEVTIERAGKVMAVVVPAAEWDAWMEKRAAEAKERFFTLVDEIYARNAHVDPEQVERDVAEAIKRVRARE